jgi:hypothetical protein
MAPIRLVIYGPPEHALEPASVRHLRRNLRFQITQVNQKLDIEVRVARERGCSATMV